MTLKLDHALDPDDVSTNPSRGPSFNDVVERRASRRVVLAGGMAGAAAFLTSNLVGAPRALANSASRVSAAELLGFSPIPLGYSDEIVVPPGYTARAFVPWGTPLTGSSPEFGPGGNSAAEQEQQVGMHHDGMHYYPMQPAGRATSVACSCSTTSTPTRATCRPGPAPFRPSRPGRPRWWRSPRLPTGSR